jgi:GT2 family glycosyltransferase
MTDLSIIIVCYKGWERLIKCLEALSLFSGGSFKAEVIVVDNKSGEETIFKIQERFTKFRFIFNEINGGFANGCNLGAKYAEGDFLLFLNPDTIVAESEVQKLLNTAKVNPEYSIVSCKQVNEYGKESIAYGTFPSSFNLTGFQRAIFRNRINQSSSNLPEISFPDWVSGSVILIKKETYRRMEGFDEDFWMYYEDVDLCRRVRNNGGEVAFCRNIFIEHNHGGSSRIDLKTTSLTKCEVLISRHVYISKHLTGYNKFLIQSFLVLNNLISGFILAFVGLLLFFIRGLISRTLLFSRLIRYYTESVLRLSWISPRSVNSVKPRF